MKKRCVISKSRSGMTLIELLSATAISLTLSVLATVSFVQILKAQQRLLTRLEMHNSGRFIYQNMSEGLSSLQPDAAMWLESTADDGTGTGTVSLTFLRGKLDEHGFTTNSCRNWGGEQDAVYQTRCTDLTWCCWKWNQKLQTLSTGECSPPRQFKILNNWTGPNGNYGSGATWFVNMPQPLRLAMPYPNVMPVGSSAAALSGNRYGSADFKNDISDYQDLTGNLAPVVRNVSNVHIEMLLADGSVIDADNTQSQIFGFDGNFVNAQCTPGANGTQPYLKRPRLIRTLIDMRDPQTGVMQSFSFSYRPANVLPTSYGTGKIIP
jgi:hypothetical protein